MLIRSLLIAIVALIAFDSTFPAFGEERVSTWRNVNEKGLDTGAAPKSGVALVARGKTPPPLRRSSARHQRAVAGVTSGNGTLPNSHGQVWREYDISRYTARVTVTKRPEQSIVDWILRETGYEAWHSEPLGILSATRRTLRVYHTQEMQDVVAEIVDRFVSSEAETQPFGMRIVTIDSPNWRTKAHGLLKQVSVQTPGVQAWMMQKEDAAVLLAQLKRRNDFREHSSPHLLVNSGQSTVVSSMRPRMYVSGVSLRNQAWPGFEAATGHVDEGFSIEFCPLLSVEGTIIDATIKCSIDQVEKMVPVVIDVPTTAAPRQRTKIEIPQITHFRFHERFRWPVDQVLVIGMGMVALPIPADGKSIIPGVPLPLPSSPARADLLVLVECKGKASIGSNRSLKSARRETKTYHGRY